jgi:hypothetical protein
MLNAGSLWLIYCNAIGFMFRLTQEKHTGNRMKSNKSSTVHCMDAVAVWDGARDVRTFFWAGPEDETAVLRRKGG